MTQRETFQQKHPMSLLTVATALCASLYALGSYITAYISSPWGVGQFRPAVVIPAFFATIFGPMPAAVGAAIGTLIVDSVKHGYFHMGSLIAAVPGNFVGFYIFGYILRRRFSWGRFVLASNITLTLANFIVAFLYIFIYKIIYLCDSRYLTMPLHTLIFLSIGLTIWWFVTMLPFVLLVTPILIRATAWATPSIVPEDVRIHSLGEDISKGLFSMALLIPGLIMLAVGLATTYTVLGEYIYTFFKEPTYSLVKWMFYLSGGALSILCLLYTSPSPRDRG